MSDRDRRDIRRGAGDAFSTSFELIATPLIFGVLGWWVDGRVGIFPVFTLLFALVALAYGVWRLYSEYVASMDEMLEHRRTTYGSGTANG